jgi:hypothetical protein
LQQREAAEFARAVPPAQAVMPDPGYLLKLERSDSA